MSLSELAEKAKALQEHIKAEARDAFQAEFKTFLDAHPNVLGFVWEQYTPYFNDGDPCEFGVREIRVIFNTPEAVKCVEDRELDDCSYDDESGGCVWGVARLNRFYDRHLCTTVDKPQGPFPADNPAIQSFAGGLKAVSNDIFKALGEGQVIVTRDGVRVDEYEHG